MGLDLSHGDIRFSYSGFHRFRTEICAYYGVDINSLSGFLHGHIHDYEKSGLPLGIVPLINHSYCDGELSVEECRVVAAALSEITLKNDEMFMDEKRKAFIAACEEAIADDKPLEFC